jgi:hypothetical protein
VVTGGQQEWKRRRSGESYWEVPSDATMAELPTEVNIVHISTLRGEESPRREAMSYELWAMGCST